MRLVHWPIQILLVGALTAVATMSAHAQQDSNPSDQRETTDSAETQRTNQPDNVVSPVTPNPAYPVDATIHAAGKAVPWTGIAGPLHYGPISVRAIEAFSVYDQFFAASSGQSSISRLELIRTNIVFDKALWKSHLVLQYTPELIMFNGHTSASADGNNFVATGATFDLSPRLSVTLKDNFGVAHSRQQFSDQLLLTDRQTGGVVQNYFLENSGTHLENKFTSIFNYKLSPRLLLTVSPEYIYGNTHNPQGDYVVNDSKNSFGLTYALSPRRNLGVLETIEFLLPVTPPTSRGFFRTSGVFYSEQLSPTLWVTGRIGLEAATYPGFHTTVHSAAGGFTLLKKFTKGDLAFAYFRGSTVANFLASRQIENGDVSYGQMLSRRLKGTSGIGFYREVGGDPRIIGKYGMGSLEYHLVGGFSLVGSYTRRHQASSTAQLLSGDRNTFVVGIRWEPGVIGAH